MATAVSKDQQESGSVRAHGLLDLLAAQASHEPTRVALRDGGRTLNYSELELRSDQWAKALSKHCPAGGLVALAAERSLETLVALLAILKAGCAYLPLDPRYPRERLALMLADSEAQLLLEDGSTDLSHHSKLSLGELEQEAASVSAGGGDGTETVYIIYTSGSTGRPKGVIMPESPLLNLLHWQLARFAGDARTVQLAPLSFDVSFQEIFSTWASGGELVLMPPQEQGDPYALLELLEREQIERLFAPYSRLQQLAEAYVERGRPPLALREVISAGEELLVTPAIRALCADNAATLDNQYGPTETHVVCAHLLSGDPVSWPERPAIGRAIPGAELVVVDGSGQTLAGDGQGELWIGGSALATGYLGQPALTSERFVTRDGGRFYLSGDIVSRREGELYFVGRDDDQVKVRGFRVELGEVEVTLARVPEFAEVAVAVKGVAKSARLIAYYVTRPGSQSPEPTTIRQRLSEELPEHMLPTAYQELSALPRTPSGKIDRQALPEPPRVRPPLTTALRQPAGEAESALAALWAELLELDMVGIDDDFFELGGHSLLATRLLTRAKPILGMQLPLRVLLERPTIAGLLQAAAEYRQQSTTTSPAADELEASALAQPLARGQEGLWLLELSDPERLQHIPLAWTIEGALDSAALAEALVDVSCRHEPLRSGYTLRERQPVLLLAEKGPPLRQLTLDEEDDLESLLRSEAERPFSFTEPGLWRSLLIELAPEQYLLSLVFHHSVFDGWSERVLRADLAEAYASRRRSEEVAWPELSYSAFARRQRATESVDQLAYWRERLADLPALKLATGVLPERRTFRAGASAFSIPPSLAARVESLARASSLSPFLVYLSAYLLLLERWSGQTDFAVGVPFLGRDNEEEQAMIGYFVNTLPIRTPLSGRGNLGQYLHELQQQSLGAQANQDIPFATLVAEMAEQRERSRYPIYQAMFAFDEAREPLRLDGLTAASEIKRPPTRAMFDLILELDHEPEGGQARLVYDRQLLSAEVIAWAQACYLRLLEEASADAVIATLLESLPAPPAGLTS